MKTEFQSPIKKPRGASDYNLGSVLYLPPSGVDHYYSWYKASILRRATEVFGVLDRPDYEYALLCINFTAVLIPVRWMDISLEALWK